MNELDEKELFNIFICMRMMELDAEYEKKHENRPDILASIYEKLAMLYKALLYQTIQKPKIRVPIPHLTPSEVILINRGKFSYESDLMIRDFLLYFCNVKVFDTNEEVKNFKERHPELCIQSLQDLLGTDKKNKKE